MSHVVAIESGSQLPRWKEEDFLKHLRQRNCIGMVAEVNDTVAGYMVYSLHREYLWLDRLAVHPDLRNQGVGTQLLNKLKSKLSKDRRTKFFVQVSEENAGFHEFLKKNGGYMAEIVRNYDEDDYLFEFNINNGSV